MTDEQNLRQIVFETLQRVAPEIEPETLAPDAPLRDQVDLDSMDWLNVLAGLHARLGVDIPETDYARLVSLGDLLAYLRAKVAPRTVAK